MRRLLSTIILALTENLKLDDMMTIAVSHINIGEAYSAMNKSTEALQMLEKGVELAELTGDSGVKDKRLLVSKVNIMKRTDCLIKPWMLLKSIKR